MDKIKTVKIKNSDGSISEESYTISVDARNVDMNNGKELQETIGTIDIDTDGNIAEQLENLNNNVDNLNNDIKKKAYFFDTVADMKTANLKAGDYVCTFGYYEANDGGGAEYKIVNDSERYFENLNNNLKAELNLKDYIIPEWLGAKGNANYFNTNNNTWYENMTKISSANYYNENTGYYYVDSNFTTQANYYDEDYNKWFLSAFDTVANNDTTILQECLNSNKICVFNKNYAIDNTLIIKGSVFCNGFIKAMSNLTDTMCQTTMQWEEHSLLLGKDVKLRLDCNNVATCAFDVGYSSFSNYDILAKNCVVYGVKNGSVTDGNNENKFKIKVSCAGGQRKSTPGTIGVKISTADSYYDEIVAINFATGVEISTDTTINILHVWPNNMSINNGTVLKVTSQNIININWFYQDGIDIGINTTAAAQINIGTFSVTFPSDYNTNNVYCTKLTNHTIVNIKQFSNVLSPILTNRFPMQNTGYARVFLQNINNNNYSASAYTRFTDIDNLPSDGTFITNTIISSIAASTENYNVLCWSSEAKLYQEIEDTNTLAKYRRTKMGWDNNWSSWERVYNYIPMDITLNCTQGTHSIYKSISVPINYIVSAIPLASYATELPEGFSLCLKEDGNQIFARWNNDLAENKNITVRILIKQ